MGSLTTPMEFLRPTACIMNMFVRQHDFLARMNKRVGHDALVYTLEVWRANPAYISLVLVIM